MYAIGSAALMAIYAAASGLLRDTIYKTLALVNETAAEKDVDASWFFIIPFWLVFGVLILVAFYLAFLDIRYIRLQFALEKRKLFEETLRDPLLSGGLDEVDSVKDGTD